MQLKQRDHQSTSLLPFFHASPCVLLCVLVVLSEYSCLPMCPIRPLLLVVSLSNPLSTFHTLHSCFGAVHLRDGCAYDTCAQIHSARRWPLARVQSVVADTFFFKAVNTERMQLRR